VGVYIYTIGAGVAAPVGGHFPFWIMGDGHDLSNPSDIICLLKVSVNETFARVKKKIGECVSLTGNPLNYHQTIKAKI